MRDEKVLLEAQFDSAVQYYVISIVLVLALTVVGIPLMIIFVPMVYILRSIEYKHIRCTLYERTLRVNRGVLNKTEKTVPLDKITDLGITQGPIMRFCGVEAISVETAGQSSGMGGALVMLVGVRNAKDFRDAVLDQRDRLDEKKPAKQETTKDESASGSTEILSEIRDTLVRIERKLGDQ